MDFHALPRRDLQALCKRNGVRANMTNVAMADALGALPTVDGIEEYVKQPAAVPVPAVAQEEVRREKQGSPLPRGRRVTAKTSEVIKPDEGKGKEEEKAEDAPPLGAVRCGAGRRARPAPAAAASVAETAVAEEEKQLPRARRATLKSSEPTKPNGGNEDEKMEANHESNKEEDAPAMGLGRRNASRRARPAPAVATAAVEPAVKTAAVEDKQGIPPPRARRVTGKSSHSEKVEAEEKEEEETENLKLEANKEDAPAQGGVRRGPSRRARPAPVVSEPAAKSAVAEELGRRVTVNVKSSAPICTDDVPPLGVGRRGVSGRAQPEPAVCAPVAEVAAEPAGPKLEEKDPSQRTRPAPVEAPATRRKAAASTTEELNVTLETVPIRPTRQRRPTMKAAATEEMVPQRAIEKAVPKNSALQQEKEEEEPLGAISDVVFVPSPSCDKGCDDPEKVVQNKVIGEPKQEDKEVSTNVDEVLIVRNVTVETIPVRPTRPRRPTMKAAAAEEEKVPRRAMKKAAASNSTLRQEKEQEGLLGAMSDSVFVPTLASDKRCDDPENVEKNADHQKVQKEVMDEPKQDDDGELAMNDDEMLAEENLTEAAPVTDQECADKSPVQQQQVDVKHCGTPLLSQDDSPILGLVSLAAGQAVEKDDAGTSDGLLEKDIGVEIHHTGEEMELVPVIQELRSSLTPDESTRNEMESSNEVVHGTCEINEVSSEYGLVCQEKGDVVDCEVLPEPMKESVAYDCSGYISQVAEEAVESMVSQSTKNEAVTDDIVSPVTVMDGKVEVVHVTDEINEVSSEDGLICQEKGDVVDCKVLPEPMEETVALDCSGYISPVAENGGVDTMVSPSAETKAVIDDIVSPVTVIDGEVVMDKVEELVTIEDVEEKKFHADFVRVHEQIEVVNLEKAEKVSVKLPPSTEATDEDNEENDFQSDFLQVDDLKEAADMEKVEMVTDPLPKRTTIVDEEVQEVDFQTDRVEQKVLSTEEMQQSTDAVVKEDILNDQLETDLVHADSVPEGIDGEVDVENMAGAITEEMVTDPLPKSTTIVGENVQEVYFQTDRVELEKVLSTEVTQQSTGPVVKEDILDDQLETDLVHADEVPELIGKDGEVDEENKAVAITEEMPESIGSMDEPVKECCFEIGLVHADELKKAVTADSLLEVTETEDEDGDVQNEKNAFTALPQELDIPRDSSDNITSALLDNVNKSLSKTAIHEATVSQDKDKPMFKNNSEITAELVCKYISDKNTDEPLCKIKSESSTAKPVSMEENMGLNVAKKSEDLNKLSLGQLKAKLRKKLKRKEEKRVALARVDENICRSNATVQERVQKLQQ